MGFGQAKVATPPYATAPNGLCMGAFNPRSGSILAPERFRRLPLPSRLSRLVVLTCL
jgi:hypothetical protein